MIWDQTYGDFGTYEEAQITTAAKGADSMNPGLTMNLIVKSGSNTFKGLGIGELPVRAISRATTSRRSCWPRAMRPASTSSRRSRTSTAKSAVRSSRTVCGSTPATETLSPATSFPDSCACPIRTSRSSSSPSCRTRRARLPGRSTTREFEGMFQVGAEVAASSQREPVRPARIHAEPRLVLADRALVQVAVDPSSQRATFDASLQRGGYWWPDYPWTTRCVRRTFDEQRATRGAFLETDRTPRRWQYGGTYTYYTSLGTQPELKTGYLGWRNIVETDNLGYPNQQVSQSQRPRPLGLQRSRNYDGCFRAPIGARLRLSEYDRVG